MLVIKHLYIERRLIPLNIVLQEAEPEQRAQAVVEYGNAIKDLLDAAFWQKHKEHIQAGHVHDVFPYEPTRRFAATRQRDIPTAQGAHHV